MTKILAYVRSNAIALLALFVALGGTSYAAFSLPAGSVGARQLRDHSIAPVKLDRRFTGAVVRYWAVVDGNGHVLASSRPRPRTLGFGFGNGQIMFGRPHPTGIRCFALGGSADRAVPASGVNLFLSQNTDVEVETNNPAGMPAPAAVTVAVLCAT